MKKERDPIRIYGDRDINLHIGNLEQHDRIALICRALSSPVRLRIINILKNNMLSIQDIAEILDIPVSSAAHYISILEEAGLVVTESQPGKRGSLRVCTASMQSLFLQAVDTDADSVDNTLTVDMPVGNYYSCDVQPTCGLADENGIIDIYDNSRIFYSPNRVNAELIWFHQGYIEYRFPNINQSLLPLYGVSFSLEICSEAPGYMEQWFSDITIYMNDIEVLTYQSPGDFGARRGLITPKSWPNGRTQYGILKNFEVRSDGGYEDGKLVNPNITLEQLKIDSRPYVSLKIEVKDDAQYIGGINIFGEKYGDYPQGIIMKLVY